MKIKKIIALITSFLVIPIQGFAQDTLETDAQTRSQLNTRSQLKICLNERTKRFYASGKCKRESVRLEYVDFRASSFGFIPSGVTVFGVIGGHYTANAANNSYNIIESLPSQTEQVFDNENDIQVVNTSAIDNECAGIN